MVLGDLFSFISCVLEGINDLVWWGQTTCTLFPFVFHCGESNGVVQPFPGRWVASRCKQSKVTVVYCSLLATFVPVVNNMRTRSSLCIVLWFPVNVSCTNNSDNVLLEFSFKYWGSHAQV